MRNLGIFWQSVSSWKNTPLLQQTSKSDSQLDTMSLRDKKKPIKFGVSPGVGPRKKVDIHTQRAEASRNQRPGPCTPRNKTCVPLRKCTKGHRNPVRSAPWEDFDGSFTVVKQMDKKTKLWMNSKESNEIWSWQMEVVIKIFKSRNPFCEGPCSPQKASPSRGVGRGLQSTSTAKIPLFISDWNRQTPPAPWNFSQKFLPRSCPTTVFWGQAARPKLQLGSFRGGGWWTHFCRRGLGTKLTFSAKKNSFHTTIFWLLYFLFNYILEHDIMQLVFPYHADSTALLGGVGLGDLGTILESTPGWELQK